uniref:Uncharacterized protein n=1 Tax=Trieres chinensis TaxID=1514140 RepID=A0A7S1ZAY1_TRICV|mmetsp:Transcript_21307/g.42999  ORF Transcript_21307/g.42999 Transcript_21307/m.42999 type:complete len:140 (+) Transcript_21307:106-525(+)
MKLPNMKEGYLLDDVKAALWTLIANDKIKTKKECWRFKKHAPQKDANQPLSHLIYLQCMSCGVDIPGNKLSSKNGGRGPQENKDRTGRDKGEQKERAYGFPYLTHTRYEGPNRQCGEESGKSKELSCQKPLKIVVRIFY